MSPPKPEAATASNAKLLGQFFPAGEIFSLPWLGEKFETAEILKKPAVRKTFSTLLRF
jgi:hypothetical protein